MSSILFLILGVVVLVAVIAGVVMVVVMARRQASGEAPASVPSDFVAPVSSGGYRFRKTDESQAEFKDRVARENAAGLPGSPR